VAEDAGVAIKQIGKGVQFQIKLAPQLFCTYNVAMRIEYDPDKNLRNIRERGLSFEQAEAFDFETALIEVDDRHDYGEPRITAIGRLNGVFHVLIFTMRGDVLRVISFRKANKREVRRYEQAA
jgi:hypothetical protein